MNKEASSRAINKEGEGDAERIQLCCCLLVLPVSSVTPGHRPCLVLAVAFPITTFSHAVHIWVVQWSWSTPGLSVLINAKIIMFRHLSRLGQCRSWSHQTSVWGLMLNRGAIPIGHHPAGQRRITAGGVKCCFWDLRCRDGTQRCHLWVTLHPSAHLI